MNRMIVKSRIGADGVLNVTVPVGSNEANREVLVTIEPAPLATTTENGFGSTEIAVATQRRTDFLKFLDELASRPLKPGPSVGPLNREELYQRGVPGH